jgi:hypothetical protein
MDGSEGIWLTDTSIEFALHAMTRLGVSCSLLPFGEEVVTTTTRQDEDGETAHGLSMEGQSVVAASSSITTCLRPMSSFVEPFLDIKDMMESVLPPCSSSKGPPSDQLPPMAVLLQDPGRRFYYLMKYADRWAHRVVADISGLHRVAGCGVTSNGCHVLSWNRGDVNLLKRRWQLAVFLGLPACVFPPLPGAPPQAHRGEQDQQQLSLEEIAHVVWECVRSASTASSRVTAAWVPLLPTAGALRVWLRFREALGFKHLPSWIAASSPPNERGQVPELVGPLSTVSSAIQPILMCGSRQRRGEGDAGCSPLWLGEDVAAVLVMRPLDEDLDDTSQFPSDRNIPLWGAVAPWQCSAQTLREKNMPSTSVVFSELHLCRNAVARGAVLFSSPILVGERDLVQSGGGGSDDGFVKVAQQIERCICAVRSPRDVHGGVACDAVEQDGTTTNNSRAAAEGQRMDEALRRMAAFGDVLQLPLQPLGDQLDGSVYATFEEDRGKYAQYHAAVKAYLEDCKRICQRKSNMGLDTCRVPVFTVLLLGAGRGPLLTECLLAATDVDVAVHVIAVEKNPAAVQFLKTKLRLDPSWRQLVNMCGHNVSIICGDGRRLSHSSQIHLVDTTVMLSCLISLREALDEWLSSVRCVVSELLGSAGDNELSPECIEAALMELAVIRSQRAERLGRLAHAGDDGNAKGAPISSSVCDEVVSIPSQVQFLVAPMQSATLLNQLLDLSRRGCAVADVLHLPSGGDDDKQSTREDTTKDIPASSRNQREVVAFHNLLVSHITRGVLLAEPQCVWTFTHGCDANHQQVLPEANHNGGNRDAHLLFQLPPSARVDVLAGYFDAVLYRRRNEHEDAVISLSTVPSRWMPRGMFSWFPCILPLVLGPVVADPDVAVPAGQRCCLSTGLTIDLHRRRAQTSSLSGRAATEVVPEGSASTGGVFFQWRASLVDHNGVELGDTPWYNEGGWAWTVRL